MQKSITKYGCGRKQASRGRRSSTCSYPFWEVWKDNRDNVLFIHSFSGARVKRENAAKERI
jgi:hypothetical protein